MSVVDDLRAVRSIGTLIEAAVKIAQKLADDRKHQQYERECLFCHAAPQRGIARNGAPSVAHAHASGCAMDAFEKAAGYRS